MSRAFVFPGQGSQAVGMGADLADAFATAREVFGEVDEALKQNLSKLMREGPESDLVLTENAQPALMAVSIAVVRVLEKDGGKPLAGLASLYGKSYECHDLARESYERLKGANMEQIFQSGLHEFLQAFIAGNTSLSQSIARNYNFP